MHLYCKVKLPIQKSQELCMLDQSNFLISIFKNEDSTIEFCVPEVLATLPDLGGW